MNILNKKTKVNLVLAAAMVIAGTTTSISIADEAKDKSMESGKCFGINECKGTSACQTADGACAGTNSCKGKGWLKETKTACETKSGKFEALSKK